jgi:hypothetical protein
MKELIGKELSDFNLWVFTHAVYDYYTSKYIYLGEYYTYKELFQIYIKRG